MQEHTSSDAPHLPSPQTFTPQTGAAFLQQSPVVSHAASQEHEPLIPPHSQVSHSSGTFGQSASHVHGSSASLHVPSPQIPGHFPHASHALGQQSPKLSHAVSHMQDPPDWPHSHGSHAPRSFLQSWGHEQGSSALEQTPSPQVVRPHTTTALAQQLPLSMQSGPQPQVSLMKPHSHGSQRSGLPLQSLSHPHESSPGSQEPSWSHGMTSSQIPQAEQAPTQHVPEAAHPSLHQATQPHVQGAQCKGTSQSTGHVHASSPRIFWQKPSPQNGAGAQAPHCPQALGQQSPRTTHASSQAHPPPEPPHSHGAHIVLSSGTSLGHTHESSYAVYPSPQWGPGLHTPQAVQALAQQVPVSVQSSAQEQPAADMPPHSQGRHETKSPAAFAQSSLQVHGSSPATSSHVPSPHSGAYSQAPQASHAPLQQSPKVAQAASHMHAPPEPSHSHGSQAAGSSGQSRGHVHEVSVPWHVPSPQPAQPSMGSMMQWPSMQSSAVQSRPSSQGSQSASAAQSQSGARSPGTHVPAAH